MADVDLETVEPDVLLEELRRRAGGAKAGAASALAREAGPADGLRALSDKELAQELLKKQKVVYGTDDRQDVFEVSDTALLADADSSIALVRPAQVSDNGDGTSTLTGPTLGAARSLCATEPFRDQPAIAFCSGFLVASNLVATAGHCLDASNVGDVRFVFGYQMQSATTPTTRISNTQIYRGVRVVGHSLGVGRSDWTVVELDRPVPDHTPLVIRSSGRISDDQEVHVIGHPSGLPKKIAGNAHVRDNSPAGHFVANLDTYGGNSGSPVFNSVTHEVEGILVRGETDYVAVGGCVQSVICPDSGCRGEDVTRASEFAHLIGGPPPWPGRFLKFPPLTRGDDVRQWQERMRVVGFSIAADGLYGANSKRACKELQRARSIAVDGIVGPDTWRETFA
jgi:hypothetical protein